MHFSGERNTYKVAPLILAAINNSWNYHLQIYNVLGAADKLFRSRIVAFWPIKFYLSPFSYPLPAVIQWPLKKVH